MKKTLLLSSLMAAAILLVQCATIIKGTKQDVRLNSNPSNAVISIKTVGDMEVYNGRTPCMVNLKRGQDYKVSIKFEGGQEQTVMINKEFNMWFLGNLLCGGVIGFIVDGIDGAMWKLEPNDLMINMSTAYNEKGILQHYAVFSLRDSKGEVKNYSLKLD